MNKCLNCGEKCWEDFCCDSCEKEYLDDEDEEAEEGEYDK